MARRTLNLPFNTGATSSADAFGAVDLLQNYVGQVGADIVPGMTIVRIRGHLNINATADGGKVQFSMGLMLLDEGQAAGTVPDMNSEILNLIWRLDGRTSGHVSETAAGTFANVDDIYLIDNRGQRKIDRVGQELKVLVGVGASINWNMAGTVRLMLPE